MKSLISLMFCFITISFLNAQEYPDFPPKDVDFEMDRDQMLQQLGISFPDLPAKIDDPNRPEKIFPEDEANPEGNWRDAGDHFITRSAFGLWNNYDQKKAGSYTPIDLLIMDDGTKIKTAQEWWDKRRPEVKKAVENEIWGVMPDEEILPKVTFKVETSSGGYGYDTYVQKEITGIIDYSRYWRIRNKPQINAVLRIPADNKKPVPVLIVFGGFGNVLERYWQITKEHGWGVCVFSPNDLQPDNGTGLTSYLIGLVNKGNWRTPEQWGTLAAWSWGISRLIDYFETDESVDEKGIAVTGHSRYGKATLVAMAYESRIAISFPSCGGALGPSMIRRHWGQDLENVGWEREYHWVAGNFFNYMGPLKEGSYLPRKLENLKVDAHALLALCAPRPVFLNGGTQDAWTDFYGTYLTAKGASPVYELLGKKGVLMDDAMPVEDKAYIDGDIGYRYHIGGHTDAPDWPAFFDFANKYVKTPVLEPLQRYMSFAAETDTSAELQIRSNRSWQIYRSEGWINMNNKSGNGSSSVLISVKKYNGLFARSARLIIRAGGIERTIFVQQAAQKPALTIAGSNLQIAEKDFQEAVFEIKSNTAWAINSSQEWIYPKEEAGINTDDVVLIADDNPSVEVREAEITVSGMGVTEPRVFKVFQRAGDPVFSCNTQSLQFPAAGGTESFWARSNTIWQVELSDDWLSVSDSTGGNGFGQITVSAQENTGEARQAKVYLKITDLADHIIEIKQQGK